MERIPITISPHRKICKRYRFTCTRDRLFCRAAIDFDLDDNKLHAWGLLSVLDNKSPTSIFPTSDSSFSSTSSVFILHLLRDFLFPWKRVSSARTSWYTYCTTSYDNSPWPFIRHSISLTRARRTMSYLMKRLHINSRKTSSSRHVCRSRSRPWTHAGTRRVCFRKISVHVFTGHLDSLIQSDIIVDTLLVTYQFEIEQLDTNLHTFTQAPVTSVNN